MLVYKYINLIKYVNWRYSPT